MKLKHCNKTLSDVKAETLGEVVHEKLAKDGD